MKTVIRFFGGYAVNPYFQCVKFSVYWYWITESYRINRNNFKIQKKAKLFKELQLEVVKFNTAIQKAKKEKEKEEEERQKQALSISRWWPFATAVKRNPEEEQQQTDHFWPFEDFKPPEEEKKMMHPIHIVGSSNLSEFDILKEKYVEKDDEQDLNKFSER